MEIAQGRALLPEYNDLLNFSELFTHVFHLNLISTLSSSGFSTLEPGFRTVQHSWFLILMGFACP